MSIFISENIFFLVPQTISIYFFRKSQRKGYNLKHLMYEGEFIQPILKLKRERKDDIIFFNLSLQLIFLKLMIFLMNK